ncbi:hypothetical protein ACFL6U_09100 [Planctomycetota bacterium]
MLLIKSGVGSTIRFFDTEQNSELGRITRLRPHSDRPHEVILGFEFGPSIKILREKLLTGKDSDHDESSQY